ncbi:hypothetical protein I79_008187 [Cricetulus griseus]|uniref:Uncharacterized protein n=1 Tax=Cricetulus griseus TaxID=10029 RepID=G3HCH6_CRIGR|nr:hypothetical protein I79_008187 [Cricetulus griseus]
MSFGERSENVLPAVHLTLPNRKCVTTFPRVAPTIGLAWRKLPSFRRYFPPLWLQFPEALPVPFGKCSLFSPLR